MQVIRDAEAYFNSIPDDVETINVSYSNIPYIPPLHRFTHLRRFYCRSNRLTSLPPFPPRLEIVSFNNNTITELPAFPPYLRSLSCISNALYTFPSIEDIPLTNVDLLGNPITRVLNIQERGSYGTNSYYLRIIRVLWRFRFLYWSLRWKRSFHRWLWASRENRIRSLYHPNRIGSLLLNAGENEEDWINIFRALS